MDSAEAWRAWARDGQPPVGSTTAPALSSMPSMLRRRLSRAGRMAAEVLYRLLGSRTQVPMIFASRHGEVARSAELLAELAGGTTLSPTVFSLSVHNAVGGIIGIARSDTAPVTALAAGADTIGAAFMEALAWLNEGETEVAVVLFEEPLPDIYQQFASAESAPHACALLLSATQGDAYRLRLQQPMESTGSSGMDLPGLFLGEIAGLDLRNGGQTWRLERDAG